MLKLIFENVAIILKSRTISFLRQCFICSICVWKKLLFFINIVYLFIVLAKLLRIWTEEAENIDFLIILSINIYINVKVVYGLISEGTVKNVKTKSKYPHSNYTNKLSELE